MGGPEREAGQGWKVWAMQDQQDVPARWYQCQAAAGGEAQSEGAGLSPQGGGRPGSSRGVGYNGTI